MPHPVLLLVTVHGLVSWAVWLNRRPLLDEAPLGVPEALGGLACTLGVLLVLVGLVALAWAALVRILALSVPAGWRGLETSPGRLATTHLVLTTLLLGSVWAVATIWASVDIMVWIVGTFWVAGFLVAGITLLVAHMGWPDSGWVDAYNLAPTGPLAAAMGAAAWTVLLALELLFHYCTGSFVLVDDMTAMLHVMRDEAIAMVFGPEALWFLTVFLVYCALCSAGALAGRAWRRRRPAPPAPTRRQIAALVVAACGLVILGMADVRQRRLWTHHVHPQVDDLAQWLVPTARPGPRDMAEARRLYPERFSPDGAPRRRDAPVLWTADEYAERARDGAVPHRNVLLVYIDSLSRRHVGWHGYQRPVTPHMDAVAAEATVFDRGRTSGGHTDLATVALFYGIHPYLSAKKVGTYTHGHGGIPVHLLAKAAGLHVGVFSGDWEVWHHGQAPLYPEACDTFLDARLAQDGPHGAAVRAWSGLPEEMLVDAFTDWYPGVVDGGGRFLAYLKLFRPHMPYHTPERSTSADAGTWRRPYEPQADNFAVTDFNPGAERAERLLARYDNAIHYADHQFGRAVAHLRATGVWEDTAVVIVADHGEGWGEHGWYVHGHQHYEELLEVPLVVRRPGIAPSTDHRMASLVDVAPTVLDLLGLPAYPNFQGSSLLAPPGPERPFRAYSNTAARLVTYELSGWKYTENIGTGEASLYDLNTDPDERRNLVWDQAADSTRRALSYLLHHDTDDQLSWVAALRAKPTTTLLTGLLGPEGGRP